MTEVDRILNDWFGEPPEHSEDELNRVRNLYEPLRRLSDQIGQLSPKALAKPIRSAILHSIDRANAEGNEMTTTKQVLQTVAKRPVTFTRRDGSIGTDIQAIEGAQYDIEIAFLAASDLIESEDQNTAFVEFAEKNIKYAESAISVHNAWRNMVEENGYTVSFYIRRVFV